MGFEGVAVIFESHPLVTLELPDQVDLLQQRIVGRAAKGDQLTEFLHAIGTQVCFVDELPGAHSRAIKNSEPVPDTLHNGHAPFVLGHFLLER